MYTRSHTHPRAKKSAHAQEHTGTFMHTCTPEHAWRPFTLVVYLPLHTQRHVRAHIKKNVIKGCAHTSVHENTHMQDRGHMHSGTKTYVSAQTQAYVCSQSLPNLCTSQGSTLTPNEALPVPNQQLVTK